MSDDRRDAAAPSDLAVPADGALTDRAPRRPQPVSGADLRAAMSHFATGVVVVTTRHDGRDHGVTINSLTSVSLDPPLVLCCIGRSSRFAEPLRAAGVWGVCILGADAAPVAARFAARTAPPEGLLTGLDHHRAGTGVALLSGALATMECRTRDVVVAGDHDIVVADVVAADVPTSVDGPGAPDTTTPSEPLLYHRRTYGTFRPAGGDPPPA